MEGGGDNSQESIIGLMETLHWGRQGSRWSTDSMWCWWGKTAQQQWCVAVAHGGVGDDVGRRQPHLGQLDNGKRGGAAAATLMQCAIT